MRTLGFIAGIVGIAAGVWITFGENDLSGLIGVLAGVACVAIASLRPQEEFE